MPLQRYADDRHYDSTIAILPGKRVSNSRPRQQIVTYTGYERVQANPWDTPGP